VTIAWNQSGKASEHNSFQVQSRIDILPTIAKTIIVRLRPTTPPGAEEKTHQTSAAPKEKAFYSGVLPAPRLHRLQTQ
jgi:hypothetical protein